MKNPNSRDSFYKFGPDLFSSAAGSGSDTKDTSKYASARTSVTGMLPLRIVPEIPFVTACVGNTPRLLSLDFGRIKPFACSVEIGGETEEIRQWLSPIEPVAPTGYVRHALSGLPVPSNGFDTNEAISNIRERVLAKRDPFPWIILQMKTRLAANFVNPSEMKRMP